MKIYKVYIEREKQAELTGCEQEVKNDILQILNEGKNNE